MTSWSRYLEGDAGRWAFRAERLRLPNGLTLGGGALERDGWQRELWEIVDDPRTQVAMFVGTRGVAKTTLGAAIGLERTVLERDHRTIAVANDSDQARLVYEAAEGFIKRDEVLSAVCECFPGRGRITNRHTGSSLQIITSDAVSAFGLGGHRTLFLADEIWGWQRRDLLDALLSAVPKAPGSQLLALTNAGHVGTPAWQLWQLCNQSTDPAFRAWDSHAAGVWPSWMSTADRDRQRLILPHVSFLRLFENQWPSDSGGFLAREAIEAQIDACLSAGDLSFREARRYFVGVDLAVRHDRAVIVVLHREREVAVVDHIRTFYGTPLLPIALEDVYGHLKHIHQLLGRRLHRLYVDEWQAVMLTERLRREGLREVESWAFTSQKVMALSQALLDAFRSKSIRIPGYTPLIDELCQLVVKEGRYHWRIDHTSSSYSDHSFALGLALLASAGDYGELIVENEHLEHVIRYTLERVRDPRRYGFRRRIGLTLTALGEPPALPTIEQLHAETRLIQAMEKADRMSRQEVDSLQRSLRVELLQQPDVRDAIAQMTDGAEPDLGPLSDFVDRVMQRPNTMETTT